MPPAPRRDVLLRRLDGDPAVEQQLSDDALLTAMIQTEAGVARASARAGVVPVAAAAAIDAALSAVHVDPAEIAARSRSGGNPVIPLVQELRRTIPEPAADWLHFGCTSQDILDTALMLIAHRASSVILDHARTAFEAAQQLADEHRGTLMVGRTLGRQALPTTFGLKAAAWAVQLHAASARLRTVRDERLAIQLGGAVGTLAAFGDSGTVVAAYLAGELGLCDPWLPWHTDRSRIHELGGALGALTAACGKAATDVVWLAQNEVAEVSEGGGADHGGSSTLPQKRNPVDAVLVRATAFRAPGLVATLLTAGLQEHERAAGGWHAEWEPLRDLLGIAGGAAGGLAALLGGLEVHPVTMAANLAQAGPALLAERLVTLLSDSRPRAVARDLVASALTGSADVPGASGSAQLVAWLRSHAVRTDADRLMIALDPQGYLGATGTLIDRAIGLRWDVAA